MPQHCAGVHCGSEDHRAETPHCRPAEHRGIAMPCNPAEELPESVRKYLPLHAQEIYRSAFSSARISYTSGG